MGAASRVWLAGSLQALKTDLQALGSDLVIRQGDSTEAILLELTRSVSAREVHCHARYEPWARKQQQQVQETLKKNGIQLVSHTSGSLLWEPAAIATQQGKPYQVFTPFFNRCMAHFPGSEPLPAPKKLLAPDRWPKSVVVHDLPLLPKISWHREIQATWQAGEKQAMRCLNTFLKEALPDYPTARNIPGESGTSRLSPHLAFGEISPRQVWQIVSAAADRQPAVSAFRKAAAAYLRELVWREFVYHVLYHFPHTVTQPLKTKFEAMPWQTDPKALRRWQQGQTGYPLVDAGMRQLWQTGWMHNRVRMVVGSFLTKDLLISWTEGARWFWDTLVDADLANNSLNWQWVAGCGADAQPFFRIFNPVGQSEKFDPQGEYIHQWVPELAALSSLDIHAPWKAVAKGKKLDYPAPIIDHTETREKALYLYRTHLPSKL